MKELKLNEGFEQNVVHHGYALDPKEEYVIKLANEQDQQSAIASSVQLMELPAINDYHNWLDDNGFFYQGTPIPTNEFVSGYFGKKPLWSTDYSQGIVVKSNEDDDYYIIMECSRLNEGFKYTQIIVTPGGCM